MGGLLWISLVEGSLGDILSNNLWVNIRDSLIESNKID
jgi:hypothetical protein